MAGEDFPKPGELPEYESDVNDGNVGNLVHGAAKAIKTFRDTVRAIEVAANRTAEAKSTFELDADSLSPMIHDQDQAKGVLFALDILAPIKDGSSWKEVAKQIATEPED